MKKKNDETAKQAYEVNEHISAALDNWADIILDMDAHNMSYYMDYFQRDIMNAAIIFSHVVTNVGIKKGLINEDTAADFGRRIREFILDATGFDATTGSMVGGPVEDSQKRVDGKISGTAIDKVVDTYMKNRGEFQRGYAAAIRDLMDEGAAAVVHVNHAVRWIIPTDDKQMQKQLSEFKDGDAVKIIIIKQDLC